jgi:hypothetical protein
LSGKETACRASVLVSASSSAVGKINEQLAREAAATGIRRAVETGTLHGDSAIALAGIFERVETIELSWYWTVRASTRLWRHRNVRFRHGDSARLLRPSSEPTLYWLDAHWSAGHAAGETRQCPLLDEVRATAPGSAGDWYLIDDARLFTDPPPPPNNPAQWPTLADIEQVFAEVRPSYEVGVREDLDLIVARPPSTSPGSC